MFKVDLKRRRERLGMSQAQLAEALHVTQVTVARWETGAFVPRMPEAVLALVDTLKPLPKARRRFAKSGRPKKVKKESR